MIIKKYQDLLNSLNKEVENGTFDIEKNKDYIEKIMEIYRESRQKNYSKVKTLLIDIEGFSNNLSVKFESNKPSMPSGSSFNVFKGLGESNLDNGKKFKIRKDTESEKSKQTNKQEEINMDFSYSEFRDWNTNDFDEDNIENFNSVEMITVLFLQNLKEKLGEK